MFTKKVKLNSLFCFPYHEKKAKYVRKTNQYFQISGIGMA
jgi:hypothetical protein